MTCIYNPNAMEVKTEESLGFTGQPTYLIWRAPGQKETTTKNKIGTTLGRHMTLATILSIEMKPFFICHEFHTVHKSLPVDGTKYWNFLHMFAHKFLLKVFKFHFVLFWL